MEREKAEDKRHRKGMALKHGGVVGNKNFFNMFPLTRDCTQQLLKPLHSYCLNCWRKPKLVKIFKMKAFKFSVLQRII
jgi:hypothetical protein